MLQEYNTSPFSSSTEETPWILWEQKTAVTALKHDKNTDGRFLNGDGQNFSSPEMQVAAHSTPLIQRKQYNAVLSRMNQAVCKTGNYSAWKT